MTYALDPVLAAAVPDLVPSDLTDPPTARVLVRARQAAGPPADLTGVVCEDLRVPGPVGAPDVALRLYRPVRVTAPAAVYDVHGGGFVLGDLDSDHARNAQIARELGVLVIAVDYRKAPETPFPGPLEDVYAGLVWAAARAGALGIDPRRVAIHGGSAGGGLCAALALLARDRGGPHVAFQYLAIPELDDRLGTPSMVAFTDTPVWSRPRAELSWDAYLGAGVRGTDAVSPYAAPARATDLTGLPPAYVSVMQFDPLRDEGIAYAQALLAAGVTVELHLFPGTFHGSSHVVGADPSRRERAEQIAVLRRALDL